MDRQSLGTTTSATSRRNTGRGVLGSVWYSLAALWPFARGTRFDWAAGRALDCWLSRGVGLSVAVLGGVLGQAGGRDGRNTGRFATLGAAVCLAAVDTACVIARGVGAVPWPSRTLSDLPLVVTWFSAPGSRG